MPSLDSGLIPDAARQALPFVPAELARYPKPFLFDFREREGSKTAVGVQYTRNCVLKINLG